MDQINILKTIQLPESITGTIKDKFDAIDSNFNALGSSTYTAGKDGVTRTHTLKFNECQVENRAEFEEWLTSQLGISNPKEVVDSIVNAFANYKKNDDWYANGSYEIYIGTDGKIKEALPILYANDKTISYLGFEYEDSSLNLNPKKDVLGIDGEGYWVINGIKTDIKAEGVAGENGKDGLAVEFGFVTVEPVEFSGSILKILQYWDYTIPNNTPMSFDNDLDAKGKDDWFDKNKNRVFLFTYETKTYMGYVTKYTHDYNSNIPESKPIYGFYYSDATMYSPGAGGSGVSGLITALDNMAYDQQVDDKPRGIWFRNSESEKDISAIFMYNNDNTLNICQIDDYTKAYNTGDIKEESTKVKVNGSFECDGATISKNATINGDANIGNNLIASSATIYNSLSVDGEMDASTMECDSATITKNLKVNTISSISNDVVINDNLSVGKRSLNIKQPTIINSSYFTIRQTDDNSNYVVADTATPEFIKNFPDLGLSKGHKYIQVGGQNDLNEARVTTITPTKITSSDLKLIGDAVVNNNLNIGDSVYINNSLKVGDSIFNGTINDKSIYCDNGVYCDNIYSMSNNSGANLFNLGCDRNGGFLELKNNELPIKTTKISNNGSIINGGVEINGTTTIKGVLFADQIATTGGSTGSSGITLDNLKVNTESILKGTTTINGDIKINNARIGIIDIIGSGNNILINLPKLYWEILEDNKDNDNINLSNISSLNNTSSILNRDNISIKSNFYDVSISNYGQGNIIYKQGDWTGLTTGGDDYTCGSTIIYNIRGTIVLSHVNRSVFNNINTNSNSNSIYIAPHILLVDDYFILCEGRDGNYIATPYGINFNGNFTTHYRFDGNSTYEYDWSNLTSTLNSSNSGTLSGISSCAQSVSTTTNNSNVKFKLLYNITKKI